MKSFQRDDIRTELWRRSRPAETLHCRGVKCPGRILDLTLSSKGCLFWAGEQSFFTHSSSRTCVALRKTHMVPVFWREWTNEDGWPIGLMDKMLKGKEARSWGPHWGKSRCPCLQMANSQRVSDAIWDHQPSVCLPAVHGHLREPRKDHLPLLNQRNRSDNPQKQELNKRFIVLSH